MRVRRPVPEGWFLAAAFAVALALRLLSFPAATSGGLRLLSPDCYGHLRRSTAVARCFPRVPFVDPYQNHPDGGVWIWPPLFDLLVGGTARLVFGRGASTGQVAWAGATLPPILGALHVFPLFSLARLTLGRRRGRLAVAAYAVLPSAVLWSCFGHADHHVLETLVLLLFLAAAASAARHVEPARRTRSTLWAGGALALALFTWQGAVFIAGVAFPWALLLGPLGAALGAAATGLLALGTAAALAGQRVPFAFVSFGWFQPALLAVGTIPLAVWAALRARRPGARVASALLAAALLLGVLPFAGRILDSTLRGGAYLTVQKTAGEGEVVDGGLKSYPADFLALVAEAKPLLSPFGAQTFTGAVRDLSVGFVLLPLALVLWGRAILRLRAQPLRRDALLLVFLFSLALFAMTLLQRRHVYYLGVFTALAVAEALGRFRPTFGAGRFRRLAGPALAAALVVLPGLPAYERVEAYREAPGRDLLDLLGRLRSLDPPGVDPAAYPPPAPGSVAGVMAPWAAGHFVTALSERPAAADPNAYGWRRHCRLYTTPDDVEAERILREARCRYLVTMDLTPMLPYYARAAGRPPLGVGAMFATRVHFSPSERPAPFLKLVLNSRTGSRLPDGRLIPRFRVFRVEGVLGR